MSNPAAGVFKRLVHKFEATFGVANGPAGGQIDRRVTSTVDLNKDTYQSQEIRTDFQRYDFRHGVRRVGGQLTGELSPGTYADFFAQALKRDFTAVTAITGLTVTIAASGAFYTLTRSTGSWITDGIRVGLGFRLTGAGLNAANVSKNLVVMALTPLVATVLVLNGVAMVAEGPIATVTATVPGKVTYLPLTGHTDKSMNIEHYYADLGQYELFLGCKTDKLGLQLPPTGLSMVTADIIGQDVQTGSGAYFSAPTAAGTGLATAAVNGALTMGGAVVASLTGLSFDIDPTFTGDPVVGSNKVPFLFPGSVVVSGQATAYFDSVTLRDQFYNETEIGMVAVLSTSNGATADFIAFTAPRLKLGGAAKDDGDKGLVQTIPFQALLNLGVIATTGYEQTTFQVHDTLAA